MTELRRHYIGMHDGDLLDLDAHAKELPTLACTRPTVSIARHPPLAITLLGASHVNITYKCQHTQHLCSN